MITKCFPKLILGVCVFNTENLNRYFDFVEKLYAFFGERKKVESFLSAILSVTLNGEHTELLDFVRSRHILIKRNDSFETVLNALEKFVTQYEAEIVAKRFK